MHRLLNAEFREYLKERIAMREVDKVQIALNDMGQHIKVDGIVGDETIDAIKSVRNSTLMKKTEELLHGEEVDIELEPSHDIIKEAMKFLGEKEYVNGRENPIVKMFHQSVGMSHWSTVSVPWCGSFMAYVCKTAGFEVPFRPYRALSWLNVGTDSRIEIGTIGVKKRKGGGHVTIVVEISDDKKTFLGLGGNQGDKVSINEYRTSSFLSFRKIDKDNNNVEIEIEDKMIDKTKTIKED